MRKSYDRTTACLVTSNIINFLKIRKMKKRIYQKPTVKVVKLQNHCQLLAASSFQTLGAGGTSINSMGADTDL